MIILWFQGSRRMRTRRYYMKLVEEEERQTFLGGRS
jgi:hypothetical protein